jgi:hypothetical protein
VISSRREVLHRVQGRIVAALTCMMVAPGMPRQRVNVPRSPTEGWGVMVGPGSLLQEEMLLAPFLNTGDLHRLSQSATWLLPYRTQLGKVRFTALHKHPVLAKLPQQKRLEQLELCGVGADLFLALRGSGAAWGDGLDIHVPKDPIFEGQTGFYCQLRKWMEVARPPFLQSLSLNAHDLCRFGEEHLVEGLAVCPNLRSLTVVGLEPCGGDRFELLGGGVKLADVLRPGCVPGLEHLSLGWAGGVGAGPNAIEAVAGRLRGCPRPRLRTLEFVDLDTSRGAAELGEALAIGACPNLLHFRFSIKGALGGIRVGRELEVLALGVAGAGCPNLRRLELWTNLGGVASLAEGLRTHGLRRLESLHVCGYIGDRGIALLADALRTSPAPCPALRTLRFPETSMTDEGCRAVARLIKEGCLRLLEELCMPHNLIRTTGAKAFLEALEI